MGFVSITVVGDSPLPYLFSPKFLWQSQNQPRQRRDQKALVALVSHRLLAVRYFARLTSFSVRAYFGDLKDGIHKGDENDPRVSIIEVVPEEIRYWMPTKGTVGRTVETGLAAATGKVAVPGELRTINNAEVVFHCCILIPVVYSRQSHLYTPYRFS